VYLFGAGSQKIDDVEVRSQVDEDFQFTDESFHCGEVCFRPNHFDGHRFDSLFGVFDSHRFRFDYTTKATNSKLYSLIFIMGAIIPF
jgi:hypothetical protein